jgi:hypothetical protein
VEGAQMRGARHGSNVGGQFNLRGPIRGSRKRKRDARREKRDFLGFSCGSRLRHHDREFGERSTVHKGSPERRSAMACREIFRPRSGERGQ